MSVVSGGGADGASKAFAAFYAEKGRLRLARRVARIAPKVARAGHQSRDQGLGISMGCPA